MIKFRCPHCQQKLGVPDDYAGRRVRCSKCSQAAVVPDPPADVPQPVDGFPVIPQQIEEDPGREEAIRLASQQRRSSEARKAESRHSSGPKRKDSSAGFSLLDRIPVALHMPLGLAASAAAVVAVVWIWMIGSRATENALCFAAFFVPLAAVLALRVFAVERTLMLGLVGLLIGGLGIIAGKTVIARHVVIPYYHQKAREVVLADLETVLADPKMQLPSGQSAQFVVRDSDFMTCIALIALVEDGQADPAEAGTRAVQILRDSKKLNVLDFFDAVTSGGGGYSPVFAEMVSEEETILTKAWQRIGQWEDQDQSLQMARKYYPALERLAMQAEIQRVLEDPDLTTKSALLSTLGLFDMVWIMLGLSLGYILAVFD